ncbi:MAG: DUF814 domain-containing protein [Nanoarchaeota archaeon]|nr:DUF814 domain-containing protein [Nanoarchaeota archaeon]
MKISLFINKSVEENASNYFEQAKKARKKLKGAKKALEISQKKKASQKEVVVNTPERKKIVKKEWFEKFRWFVSSEGFLIIGGRDATTNEIVIKKYTDKEDLVLHTQMAGSPFVIIKAEGKKIDDKTLDEAAVFTGSVSAAWKNGMSSSLVEYVKPDQVTKEANAGEFLPKGAFMIRGKTQHKTVPLAYGVGIYKDKIMGGPITAIEKNCESFVEIVQGAEKPSDIAKKIKSKIGGELDEIIRALPSGGCVLKKRDSERVKEMIARSKYKESK